MVRPLVIVLLALVAASSARPQRDNGGGTPTAFIHVTDHYSGGDGAGQNDAARVAADAALNAADKNNKLGLDGKWDPKTVGIRVYQSKDKNFNVGLGLSTDFKKDHGVGVGVQIKF